MAINQQHLEEIYCTVNNINFTSLKINLAKIKVVEEKRKASKQTPPQNQTKTTKKPLQINQPTKKPQAQ